ERPERDVAQVLPERTRLVDDAVVDHPAREVGDLQQSDRVDDHHGEHPLQRALLSLEQCPEERRARDAERVHVLLQPPPEPAELVHVGRPGGLELRRLRDGLRHERVPPRTGVLVEPERSMTSRVEPRYEATTCGCSRTDSHSPSTTTRPRSSVRMRSDTP